VEYLESTELLELFVNQPVNPFYLRFAIR